MSHPVYVFAHYPPLCVVSLEEPLFRVHDKEAEPALFDQAITAILSHALFTIGFEGFRTMAERLTPSFRLWAFPTFTNNTRFKAQIPAYTVHSWLERTLTSQGFELARHPYSTPETTAIHFAIPVDSDILNDKEERPVKSKPKSKTRKKKGAKHARQTEDEG